MDEEKNAATPPAPARTQDEIALELMKFVAVTTGYGKGAPVTGYATSKATRTSEEYADALLDLFEHCRALLRQ
jgi:hypothetical protein